MDSMNRIRVAAGLGAAIAALALALPIGAGTAEDKSPNPYLMSNNSWISIGGKVIDVSANRFMLDYGKGLVRVEMDDGDRDADGYKLVAGDKVTVNGKIDDDFFEQTKIEASSVYVEKLGTHFWASAADEEDTFLFTSLGPVVVDSFTVVSGTVSKVNPPEHEFTLDTGPRMLTIEVDEMAYDPLDDEGYQKIRPGDVVRASGRLDEDDLFEGRALEAESIITLSSR